MDPKALQDNQYDSLFKLNNSYLCRAFLDQANPYKHFNTPHLQCYMQLWVMEDGDGELDNNNFHPDPVVDNQFVQQENDPPPPALVPPAPAPEYVLEIPRVRLNRRAQLGLARLPPLQGHANGLQRFLAMAAADEEDGWNSDELDDADDNDEDDI